MKSIARIAVLALLAFALAAFAPPVRADTSSSPTAAPTTSFATGALTLGGHGHVTALAGYSGAVADIPSIAVGGATGYLSGFIGVEPSGGKQYGFGLAPALKWGSLSVGVGVFEDVSTWSTHPMFSLSFSLK